MKMLSIAVLASTLALAGPAPAQDTKAPPSSSGAQPACCMDSQAQMGRMDEHMQKMQALHDRMANASPDERQKLMAEQRQEMQRGMTMMQPMQHGGMMGGPMMGGAGMGGPTKGPGKGTSGQKPAPADQRTRMQMMEKRLDMMQMMMQSMMDQQSGMGTGAMPGPSK